MPNNDPPVSAVFVTVVLRVLVESSVRASTSVHAVGGSAVFDVVCQVRCMSFVSGPFTQLGFP